VAGSGAQLFTAVSLVGSSSDLLMRFHGFIMMAAWLGCAGTGIMLARYFKGTWKVNKDTVIHFYFNLKL
jgi:hypothetical protein